MAAKNNPVKLWAFSTDSHNYVCMDKEYSFSDLIEASKDLESFDLPLQGVFIGNNPWGEMSIKSFAYHVQRTNDADLSYPIILDTEGYICDGWHRVVKAILKGDTMIKAVRLEVMPEPVIIK
jgi:hypothetical protein